MSTIERIFGRVKWFNNKAGYGFITVIDGPKAGSDLFVHHSSIQIAVEQYKYLVQGEYVEFTLSSVASGVHDSQAADVTGIRRGLLMCETRQSALDYSQQSHQQEEEKPKQKKTALAPAPAPAPTVAAHPEAAWTPVSKRSPRHDKELGQGSQGRGSRGGRGSQGRGPQGRGSQGRGSQGRGPK
jgi:cold shock CspA family protein